MTRKPCPVDREQFEELARQSARYFMDEEWIEDHPESIYGIRTDEAAIMCGMASKAFRNRARQLLNPEKYGELPEWFFDGKSDIHPLDFTKAYYRSSERIRSVVNMLLEASGKKDAAELFMEHPEKWEERQGANGDVKKLMRERGVTNFAISRHLGIGSATISRWLAREMAPEKKQMVVEAIKQIPRKGSNKKRRRKRNELRKLENQRADRENA